MLSIQNDPKRERAIHALASYLYEEYSKADNKLAGLQAIAAELTAFIDADVKQKVITGLLLDEMQPTQGTVQLATDPEHTSWWLDENGDFKSSMDIPSLTSLPNYPITSALPSASQPTSEHHEQADQKRPEEAVVPARRPRLRASRDGGPKRLCSQIPSLC